MTPQRQDQVKRLGAILAVIVSGVILLTAAKGGIESWLVTRSEYRDDQHRMEVWLVRDSLFKQKVSRRIDYENCKERYGRGSCLDPDRP